MGNRRLIGLLVASSVLFLSPKQAAAQYKNSSFGFDVAGWLITKPDILDDKGQVIDNPDNRPLRLQNGVRFGGETNIKLDQDHWWA